MVLLLQAEYKFTQEDVSQKHWGRRGAWEVLMGQSQHPLLARVSEAIYNAVNVNRPSPVVTALGETPQFHSWYLALK